MTLSRWLLAGTVVTLLLCAWIAEVHSAQRRSQQPASKPASKPARPKLPRGLAAKKLTMPDGSVRKYAIFVPPQYKLDESHKWPLIIALHGSGEIGEDGIKQTTIGLAPYIVGHAQKFPFIAVFPQAHAMWFRGAEEAAIWMILDATLKEYRVDMDRIYLTGLSMGGFATWEMAASRPDVFAAIVPICGAGPLGYMSNILNLPVWAFHGSIDPNVPVARSRELIDELKRLGAKPKYTEYSEVAHDSWTRAYATPELWRWLLKQHKPPPPRVIDYKLTSPETRVWWLAVQADMAAKAPPHVRAEIAEDGRLTIESTDVIAWMVLPGPEPLQPGKEIEVTWNGQPVFKGEFSGGFGIAPSSQPSSEPSSEPASRPAD
jgi:poly(3-hydroxybutyrate) depolymerase